MIKGTGPILQSIIVILGVIALTVMLVVFILFISSRDLIIALEETKIYTVNNVFNGLETSMNAFWRIASSQAVHSLQKESAEWGWGAVTNEFVEGRLKDNSLLLIEERREKNKLDINRADVEITDFSPVFKIGQNNVQLDASQLIKINFFDASINTEINTKHNVDSSLGKIIEAGNLLKDTIETTVPDYTQSDTRESYENNAPIAIFNSLSTVWGNTRIETEEYNIKAGDAGLVLQYAVDSVFIDDSVLPYFDGNMIMDKPVELRVKVKGEKQILDCNSEALYTLLRKNDMLCSSGSVYTCGTGLKGMSSENILTTGESVSNMYGCMETQSFCYISEADSSPPCCTAFGRTYDEQSGVCI